MPSDLLTEQHSLDLNNPESNLLDDKVPMNGLLCDSEVQKKKKKNEASPSSGQTPEPSQYLPSSPLSAVFAKD